MFHSITLPKITRRNLTKAMWWQFDLLIWAARAPTVNREECGKWLQRHPVHRVGADAIARWTFSWEDARESICKFAEDTTAKPDEKIRWIRQRRREAKRLLCKPKGEIDNVIYPSVKNPTWQTHAKTFWISFYNRFRKQGLPAELLGPYVTDGFTDQIFLKSFLDRNKHLCVCPVCDTTAFFTVVQREKGSEVYTDIDHYLPKSSYPHLAIHPYNLMPLCHNCNSGTKGEEDPLDAGSGTRYKLEDIWLPYRHAGLSRSLYVTIIPAGKDLLFDAFVLKSGGDMPAQLDAVIDVLSRVYDIPGRWKQRMEEISDKLFRRMRDYSRFYGTPPIESNALEHFDELLFLFDQEDAAREPYAIPMAWLLVYLLNAERSIHGKPLRDEVSNRTYALPSNHS